MSTSKTYQQSLADAGSETRPPMLERGSYIPWAILKLQTAEDLHGDALLHYDAEMELMKKPFGSLLRDVLDKANEMICYRHLKIFSVTLTFLLISLSE
ncbi:hypothetical protein Tco_0528347 [Tanacetum coccineum]